MIDMQIYQILKGYSIMSRQFNSSLASYNRLMRMLDKKPKDQIVKNMGLLSPPRIKNDMDKEDMAQPINRILKHFTAIKEKRSELNGS